ncbi:MAG: radical SAM protein, partial [Planctomycetota bacterium]
MRPAAPTPRPDSLPGLERGEVEALLDGLGEPPYRARQLYAWVHARRVDRYDAMTDLPDALRRRLRAAVALRSTRRLERTVSGDGTRKLLLGLDDREAVECVLIPEPKRTTACLSTQVGCGVGCPFCASGAEGVVRNLRPGEIVEQFLQLAAAAEERITHVVVMGMGEPLHNVAALAKALRILMEPGGIDLGPRRVTVSTSGPVRGFEELLRAG